MDDQPRSYTIKNNERLQVLGQCYDSAGDFSILDHSLELNDSLIRILWTFYDLVLGLHRTEWTAKFNHSMFDCAEEIPRLIQNVLFVGILLGCWNRNLNEN